MCNGQTIILRHFVCNKAMAVQPWCIKIYKLSIVYEMSQAVFGVLECCVVTK